MGFVGGATRFTQLADAPQSYAGQAQRALRVALAETGLEFADLAGVMEQVASVTLAVAGTFDLAGLAAQGFPVLLFQGTLRQTNDTANARMRFNDINALIHNWSGHNVRGGSVHEVIANQSSLQVTVGRSQGGKSTADAQVWGWVANRQSDNHPFKVFYNYMQDLAGQAEDVAIGGSYSPAAASQPPDFITRIRLDVSAGSFAAGSRLTVWGLRVS